MSLDGSRYLSNLVECPVVHMIVVVSVTGANAAGEIISKYAGVSIPPGLFNHADPLSVTDLGHVLSASERE